MTLAGFPHSEIFGSMAVCASPKLIAACRVLHRLPVPRHPPCALNIFFSYNSGFGYRILDTLAIVMMLVPGRPKAARVKDHLSLNAMQLSRCAKARMKAPSGTEPRKPDAEIAGEKPGGSLRRDP